MFPQTELIHYTTVEAMAQTYADASAKIRAATTALGAELNRLKTVFSPEYTYKFSASLQYMQQQYEPSEDGAAQLLDRLQLECWSMVIDKLNIRRLMSSKRAKDLDDVLAGKTPYDGERQTWPALTPENIERVAQGYLMSANEFLEEAIAEEYDFWRPRTDHKTNATFWALSRKVIEPYMVERGYGQYPFRLNYSRGQHVTALDNIFHLLDGKGPVAAHKGELGSAIEVSPDGTGETTYFKFKSFKNGNLHLEFKRQDLLDLFNQIAAKRDRPRIVTPNPQSPLGPCRPEDLHGRASAVDQILARPRHAQRRV